MTATESLGRRERKKAATRKTISDVATRMFIERGYDEVSIREIADAADVSPTTVFAHFPQKEALVFDEDDEQRDRLVAVVRERPPGTSISQALYDFYAHEIRLSSDEHGDEAIRSFVRFFQKTPALRDYAERMWLRHSTALAEAIADEVGLSAPDDQLRIFARFVLQMQMVVNESDDPLAALDAGFAILAHGWSEPEAPRADG